MVDQEEKRIVGRTWADVFHGSETGPVVDTLVARIVGWLSNGAAVAEERVKLAFLWAAKKVEATGKEPRAIPERVGVAVAQAVGVEDREELHELWANLLANSALGMEIDEFAVSLLRQLDPRSAALLTYAGGRFQQAMMLRGSVSVHAAAVGTSSADIIANPPTGLSGNETLQQSSKLLALGLLQMLSSLQMVHVLVSPMGTEFLRIVSSPDAVAAPPKPGNRVVQDSSGEPDQIGVKARAS